MEELWSLLNVEQRLGSSWRPVEQTVVERAHQEEQKELGIFLHGVFECAPGHWGGLLALAEFVLWNTPGKFGLSPRDLVMGWPLASPLERELLPLELPRRESVSDVAAAQFEQFRRLRERHLALKSKESTRGAALANRSRSSRRPLVGDRVLYNDPKLRKAVAGHGPGKRALRGPFEVRAVR